MDEAKKCSACGASAEKLLRCSTCSQTCYCSSQCQRAAWPAHKLECKTIHGLRNVVVASPTRELVGGCCACCGLLLKRTIDDDNDAGDPDGVFFAKNPRPEREPPVDRLLEQ